MNKAMNIEGLAVSSELIRTIKTWILPSSDFDKETVILDNIRAIEDTQTYFMELWNTGGMESEVVKPFLVGLNWAKQHLIELNRLVLVANSQEGGCNA